MKKSFSWWTKNGRAKRPTLRPKQWWLTLVDYNLFVDPAKCNQVWYL